MKWCVFWRNNVNFIPLCDRSFSSTNPDIAAASNRVTIFNKREICHKPEAQSNDCVLYTIVAQTQARTGQQHHYDLSSKSSLLTSDHDHIVVYLFEVDAAISIITVLLLVLLLLLLVSCVVLYRSSHCYVNVSFSFK